MLISKDRLLSTPTTHPYIFPSSIHPSIHPPIQPPNKYFLSTDLDFRDKIGNYCLLALKEPSRGQNFLPLIVWFPKNLNTLYHFILIPEIRLVTNKWANYFYLAGYPCCME
jgi:hypothetical protein